MLQGLLLVVSIISKMISLTQQIGNECTLVVRSKASSKHDCYWTEQPKLGKITLIFPQDMGAMYCM